MNTKRLGWMILAAILSAAGTPAQTIVTNRLTLSARLGFNISARFKGDASSLIMPANTRTTPGGSLYNYDDGYVLGDSSGNFGGQTWHWGYDSSASQIAGNTILLSRSTPAGEFKSPSFNDDPSWGAELAYNRWIGQWRNLSYGAELAGNWQSLSMDNRSTFHGYASRLINAYPFTPGTTPPAATFNPYSPYQGNYGDQGFLLGDTPVNSMSSLVPGGSEITGYRQYEADLWGFRLGPYITVPLTERLLLGFSGGLALGLLDGEASWSETVRVGANQVSSSGQGNDFGVLWGAYAAANLSWHFNQRWSATAGAQYQYLNSYEESFGQRRVEVDLSNSFFLLLGIGYHF